MASLLKDCLGGHGFRGRAAARFVMLGVLTLLPSIVARADNDDKAAQDDNGSSARRAARLERMRRRAESLTLLCGGGEAAPRVAVRRTPLLHYNDLAGFTTDGTIWAWGEKGRPLALAGIFYEQKAAGQEKWSCELLALADSEIAVESRSHWRWRPKNSDLELRRFTEAPPPGETPRLRGRQMNELSRRFAASETFSAERTDQLRLMERPLQRYADAESGLVDGALYAFAGGTNPEILFLLECRAEADQPPAWYYAFARMGAAQVQVRLNDAVVWTRPGIERWDPSEAYYSMFGSNEVVFRVDDAELAPRESTDH